MIIKSLKLIRVYSKLNKSGEIELDQLGKLIIGLILFIILIYIVTVLIGGEIGNQSDEVDDIFNTIG